MISARDNLLSFTELLLALLLLLLVNLFLIILLPTAPVVFGCGGEFLGILPDVLFDFIISSPGLVFDESMVNFYYCEFFADYTICYY